MTVKMKYYLCMALLAVGFSAVAEETIPATQADIGHVETRQDMTVNQGISAQQLWEALCETVPPGVTIRSVTMGRDQARQMGSYQNIPPIESVQMKDGIVLTSGSANNCLGPNNSTGIGQFGVGAWGMVGDNDLSALVGGTTKDAAVLEIKFDSDNTIPGFSFIFAFGTDEYPEYLNQKWNDVYACFHNGKNICYDMQGNLICLNNVFFGVDNTDGHLNLEYDGFTVVLQTSQKITPGSHTVKFAIADVEDEKWSSGVFLCDFRFDTTNQGTHPVVDIIADQEFTIDETATGPDLVGTITNLCKYTPITVFEAIDIDEFLLDGWDIHVANGVVFDAGNQNQYIMKIRATLDTTWGGDPWIVHDSADMTINIESNNTNPWPQITKSVICDDDGNGIGDSIYAELTFDFPDMYTLSQAEFSWPDGQIDYAESIDNSNLYNKKTIAFSFTPDNTAPVWTDGESSLAVTIDSLGQSSAHSAKLEDGIGPVLIKAAVVKRYVPGPDTFYVTVSEPVNVDAITGNSFILIKGDNGDQINIEPLGGDVEDLGNEKYIKFMITDLNADAPEMGDSLKILHTGPVIDKKVNKAHENNPPVPIEFLDGNLDSWPQITRAVIHDHNGNGIGDSITIAFDGNFVDSMSIKEAQFSWPQGQIDYTENIDDGNQFNNTIIAFSYNPGASAPVWTHGESDITITIDSLGEEISRSSALEDGIGPILTEAFVVKRYIPMDDTFRVRLSEAVKVADITGSSFVLIKGDNGDEITIEPFGGEVTDLSDELYLEFLVADLDDDAPEEGDSLKILYSGPVKDKKDNAAHKDNPPVPIQFLDCMVPPKKADYYDIDGNGYVDRVRVEFVDTLNNLDSLFFEAAWVDINETVAVNAAAFESGTKTVVALRVAEEIADKTSGDMTLTVKNDPDAGGRTVTVNDKTAPVIVAATYYPCNFSTNTQSDKDSLIVVFSESVNDIASDKPFLLEAQTGTGYYFTLDQKARADETVIFDVLDINGVNAPQESDSICINADEGVEDILSNEQTVKDNKKVQLRIVWPTFTLNPKVIGPVKSDEKEIPGVFQISDGIKTGIVIALEPVLYVPHHILDKIDCRMKIFDAVGNKLASCDGRDDKNGILEIDLPDVPTGPNNMIVILWSGKNSNMRNVGSGSYCGVIEIINENGDTEDKTVTIPVVR